MCVFSLMRIYGVRLVTGTMYFFWTGRLVGDVPLCVKFRCRFELAVTQRATIADMFALGLGDGYEVWKWQRGLWAWEK